MNVEKLRTQEQPVGELRLSAIAVALLDETFGELAVKRPMAAAFADLCEQLDAIKANIPPETPKRAA